MSEGLQAELGRIVDDLAGSATPLESAQLAQVAERIAKDFGVKPDEVAILTLVEESKFLRFLLPEKLQAIGTIPLTSATALAVRTIREKRAELVSNFAAARHISVFEGVPLGRRRGELIHKIMSVPIVADGKALGVVQISHKGRTPADAGPDFTQKDLRELESITGVLARFVKICQGS
jgi:GAF domain-containing protein